AVLLARFAPSVSAGFANYDWRHQHYFTRICEDAAHDESLVHREWDGIATALFRERGRGLSQAARSTLVRLGAALGGVDLSGARIDRLMLDGARLDDARLDRCDLSS